MNNLIILAVIALFATVVFCRPEEKYPNTFDNINLQQVFENKRLFEKYYKCLNSESNGDRMKNCKTKEEKMLREKLPEALDTDCAKCTDAQKKKAEEAIKILCKDYPSEWKTLKSKYDKENKYASKHPEFNC